VGRALVRAKFSCPRSRMWVEHDNVVCFLNLQLAAGRA